MAYLILPSTLRRQPSFLTGVANDSLTSGLVLAWTGAVNADQSVFRRVPYMYGSGIFQPSVGRIGYCGNAAGSLSFTIPGNNGAVTIYREFELLSTALYTTPKLSYGVPYGSSINNNFFVSSSNFVSDSGSVVLGAHRGLNTLNTVWSVYPGSGTGMTFQVNDSNDVTVGSGGAAVSGDVAVRLFANPNGPEFGLTGDVVCSLFLIWHRALSIGERQTIKANPWQLFEPLPSRLYFLSPTGGGGTTVEAAAAGRERAIGADTVAATKTGVAAGRERAAGADTVAPIKTAVAAGRERGAGVSTVAPTRAVAAVGRSSSRGASTASQVAPGVIESAAAGRERASGTASVAPIKVADAAGQERTRGAAAVGPLRAVTVAGRAAARGAASAAPVVAGQVETVAAGRTRARGAASVAGTRSGSIAGRLYVRGTGATTSTRAALAAGRIRARGTAPIGVIPVFDSPAPTRMLTDSTTRIGSSPASADTRRIGASPIPHTPRRLG